MWRFWFKFHNVWTWRNPELFEVTLHAGLFEDLVEVIWCEALSATMSRSIWSHSRGRGAQILIEVPAMSRGCLRCLIAYVALVGRHCVRRLPVPGDAGYEHKMLEGAKYVRMLSEEVSCTQGLSEVDNLCRIWKLTTGWKNYDVICGAQKAMWRGYLKRSAVSTLI